MLLYCTIVTIILLLQFYPFGFAYNDTALLALYSNANSTPITLSEDFYFYDDLVRTAYVSNLIKMYACL